MDKKIKVLIVCIIAGPLCFFPVFSDQISGNIPYSHHFGFSVYEAGTDESMDMSPEITGDTVLTQTFVCTLENTSTIELKACTFGRINSGIMHIILSVDDTGEEICSWDLDLREFKNDHIFTIVVRNPFSGDSLAGTRCRLTFSSPGTAEGSGISLYYANKDLYPNGELMINGQDAGGDLYMLMTGSEGTAGYEHVRVILCFYLLIGVETVLYFFLNRRREA